MKAKQVMIVTVAIMIGVMLGATVGPVQAAFFDRDKLAQALSTRFNLNESEVAAFLADFQYHPDATPVPTATPAPSAIVRSGVEYQYDDYTDNYYPTTKIVSIQHQNQLDFIAGKLSTAVTSGKMTAALKRKILSKLAAMMDKNPSSAEFVKLDLAAQNAAIATFKKEMDAWLQAQGMTLAQLRDMTGKGNKFLMGIYF